MTWQMYGQEKREEGLEEGLGALVQALFQFTTDFEKLYESIRNTPAYTNATIEQVRKYYDPLIAQATLHNQSK